MHGKPALNPLLKFALELGPLIVFFLANARWGIFAGTAAFMVAVLLALAVSYALTRHLPIVALISTAIVVVFGVSLIIMKIIRSLKGSWNLRLSQEGELEGMDIHEHGTPAYHMEFGQGMTYSTPAGLPGNGLPKEHVPAPSTEVPV